ncbi:MAG TPA: adenylate/guanylate cyclase domain-containing protein [Anaerolineae bacterium]|nr:adenylate/guanylate cyclase domain-containing protein [Anaerolineae bacterium]HQH39488.1 adenylate/guanylate cyclase domain-containing protein [Anaerolineae bacterium]
MVKESELKAQLAFSQKALDIVLAMDHIRDTAPGPTAIFSGLAHVICDQFQANVCLVYVVDRETRALELRVVQEGDRAWRAIAETLTETCVREAMHKRQVMLWKAADILPPALTSTLPETFRMAAIPVFMDEKPLGAVLMGRHASAFDADEVRLMQIAESQMDSAIVQAYVDHDLAQRNKELETIYRFDQIRDQYLPFDEMLDVVLQELCRVIDAEMGFVMLYDQTGKQLEMRAVTHDDLLQKVVYYETMTRAANTAIRRAQLTYEEYETPPCVILTIPLILRNEIIGVFGAVNREPQRRFTRDHQRLLKAIVSQMDTAIFESLEQRRLRRVLGRSLDARVLDRMLANPNVDILKGERMVLTVLYGDLRGSTPMALQLQPETLVEFINDYLGRMTQIIHAYEGTLDKYIGDEVMALFGAPLPQPDHALRAVRVGLEMQTVHRRLMADWATRGVAAAALGIGIATGEVVVGEFGCELRTDYTIIGSTANLGARICAVAKPDEVLISPATYDLVKDAVEATPIPGMHFKGIDEEVTVYAVTRVLE